jgi:ribonuclease J
MALLKPKFFMPIHGEYRHLYANKEIGEFMGIPSQNIFVAECGRVLEVDKKSAKFEGTVPAGNVLVDGSGVGDIGSVVLRDRKHLAEDGLVMVVATVDIRGGYIISGPDIISRGFIYMKESEALLDEARSLAFETLENAISRRGGDRTQIKNAIRDELGRFFFKKTKRKPMVLSVIMEI